VRSEWFECSTDALVIENMTMCYEEVRDTLQTQGIMTRAAVDEQVALLRNLPVEGLPAVWGAFRVTGEA
jgi:hypothetical protein